MLNAGLFFIQALKPEVTMRYLHVLSFLTLLLLAPSAPVRAQDWVNFHSANFTYTPSFNNKPDFFYGFAIADKVHYYFWYKIDPTTGNGWARAHVTNGERVKGFTTCAELIFSGPDVTTSARFRLGVNPDSSNTAERPLSMDVSAWNRITNVSLRAGWCPNHDRFLNEIINVFEEIYNASAFKTKPPEPVTSDPSSTPETFPVYWTSAIVYCARPSVGTSGGVSIQRVSRNSCEEASAIVRDEAESGAACRNFFASDSVLSGAVNYAQGCGSGVMTQAQFDATQ